MHPCIHAPQSGIVHIGEQLWAKVVEVVDDGGERGPKIQCSIKLVRAAAAAAALPASACPPDC